MLCQKCGSAEAAVHYTNIVDGTAITDAHLCAGCASAAGVVAGPPAVMLQGMLEAMGVDKSLAGEINKVLAAGAGGGAPLGTLACPHCGTTLLDFQRNGRLGCPRDYEVFRDALLNLIRLAQAGSTRHVGKVPRNAPPETRLAVLNARVEHLLRRQANAIASEEYELAARLRDEISAIRDEMADPQSPDQI